MFSLRGRDDLAGLGDMLVVLGILMAGTRYLDIHAV